MNRRNRKKGEVATLTGPQHTAVMALAAEHLKKEAAEKAGVCAQSISTWLREPHFQAALDSLRGELVSHATLQLRSMTATAILASREILESGADPARLRAATYVLDKLIASQVAAQPDPVPEVSTEEVLQAIGFGR